MISSLFVQLYVLAKCQCHTGEVSAASVIELYMVLDPCQKTYTKTYKSLFPGQPKINHNPGGYAEIPMSLGNIPMPSPE